VGDTLIPPPPTATDAVEHGASSQAEERT
jgi:hypothetical protein